MDYDPFCKSYIIRCSTGCSCCSYENHYRGPYSSRKVAEERCKVFTSIRLLASQYARNGNYTIEEHEAEVLPDGRIIIDGTVFAGWADPGSACGVDEQIERKWDAA